MANCPLCAQEASALFAGSKWRITPDGRTFHYAFCPACQFAFCNPLPTEAELAQYYASGFDYGWYARHARLKQWQARHRWLRVGSSLEKMIGGPGELLDIGCGHGWFMQAARRANWRVTGLDLPGPAVTYARAVGLDVIEGAVEKIELPAHHFDVITLWHMLEHASNPLLVLESVRRWLKPRGVVVIAVPNLHAAGLNRRGAQWVWLQQPFVHLWHWSAQSLKATLVRTGFQAVHIETRDTWDAQYLYDAVLNPRWEKKYLARMEQLLTSMAERGGVRPPEQKGERVTFALAETSRLLSYGSYLTLGWATRRKSPDAGSELLVFAQPNDSAVS